MPPAGTAAAATVEDRRDALAQHMLVVLRACSAIAEASLDEVAPTVSLQQFRALTVLHEHGPQNAATVADALGIARSTMTRLANRLVRDGLVDRSSDPADRRAVVLSLTRRGHRTAERVKAWRLRALADRFVGVIANDARALDDALAMVGTLLTREGD
jgi:DNA-binding MarR family transcriptional regulator